MDMSSLPAQFGRPEFYRSYDKDGMHGLVVVEMWKGRRWITLYHQREQQWIVVRRYVCCGHDGLLARVHQEYAPRWLYGASVDEEGSYVVVEKDEFVWILCYDIDLEYCCLLEMIELPSLDNVACPLEQYLGLLIDDNAEVQLREILPTHSNLDEVYLIETIDVQVSYMIEDTGSYRRLFRYLWVEGSWRSDGLFEGVDRARWNDVEQKTTDIFDIFEGRSAVDTIRIVIEDGIVVRWWHTYLFRSNRWEICYSHHAVVEGEDGNMFVYNDESSLEPDFVDLVEDI